MGKKLIRTCKYPRQIPIFSHGYTAENHFTLVEFDLNKNNENGFTLLISRRLKSTFYLFLRIKIGLTNPTILPANYLTSEALFDSISLPHYFVHSPKTPV